MKLTVIYEDNALLIIDKPAGVLTHPVHNRHQATIREAVLDYYRSQNCRAGFHPLHRLDRQTSGILVVAKLPAVQAILHHRQTRAMHRTYLALVDGSPRPFSGVVDQPIGRKPGSIIERQVTPDGQTARTRWRTIRRFTGATLIAVRIFSGRTHQIRVHCHWLGHPVLGDTLYGTDRTSPASRPMLHAAGLSMRHPVTGRVINLRSPLPPDFRRIINLLERP
ncbi:MAG: RluA family pseudouridine synthase [Negativicutes bacterium]|nr:RluA family pseudouridine synthase [Negativicutes bacterium]